MCHRLRQQAGSYTGSASFTDLVCAEDSLWERDRLAGECDVSVSIDVGDQLPSRTKLFLVYPLDEQAVLVSRHDYDASAIVSPRGSWQRFQQYHNDHK